MVVAVVLEVAVMAVALVVMAVVVLGGGYLLLEIYTSCVSFYTVDLIWITLIECPLKEGNNLRRTTTT